MGKIYQQIVKKRLNIGKSLQLLDKKYVKSGLKIGQKSAKIRIFFYSLCTIVQMKP